MGRLSAALRLASPGQHAIELVAQSDVELDRYLAHVARHLTNRVRDGRPRWCRSGEFFEALPLALPASRPATSLYPGRPEPYRGTGSFASTDHGRGAGQPTASKTAIGSR